MIQDCVYSAHYTVYLVIYVVVQYIFLEFIWEFEIYE